MYNIIDKFFKGSFSTITLGIINNYFSNVTIIKYQFCHKRKSIYKLSCASSSCNWSTNIPSFYYFDVRCGAHVRKIALPHVRCACVLLIFEMRCAIALLHTFLKKNARFSVLEHPFSNLEHLFLFWNILFLIQIILSCFQTFFFCV